MAAAYAYHNKTMMGVASGKKKKDYLASIFRELSTGE